MIEINYNHSEHEREDVKWNCWSTIVITFQRCGFKYENFWYDGEHRTLELGFVSFYFGNGTDFHEKHSKQYLEKAIKLLNNQENKNDAVNKFLSNFGKIS